MPNREQNLMIERLYREMYSSMRSYAENALNDRSFAEEAVQDTFRIACAKCDSLEVSLNPRGWLMNTLKYAIRNIRRHQAQNAQLAAETVLCESTFAENCIEKSTCVLYSDLLSQADFKLLKRSVLDGASVSELSKEFDISVEACKKRLQRARERLKREVEKI